MQDYHAIYVLSFSPLKTNMKRGGERVPADFIVKQRLRWQIAADQALTARSVFLGFGGIVGIGLLSL